MDGCFMYWMELIIYVLYTPVIGEVDNEIIHRYGEYFGL
jgi:hypothetical protein